MCEERALVGSIEPWSGQVKTMHVFPHVRLEGATGSAADVQARRPGAADGAHGEDEDLFWAPDTLSPGVPSCIPAMHLILRPVIWIVSGLQNTWQLSAHLTPSNQ